MTMHSLKWACILFGLFLGLITVTVFIQEGMHSMHDFVVFGVEGFFTFFMGYFGWMIAAHSVEVVDGKKRSHAGPHDDLMQ